MISKKMKILTLGVLAAMMITSTPTLAATNTKITSNVNAAVSEVGLPSLTVTRSQSAISINGMCIISGYAKNSDGTPLVNAIIWVKIDNQLFDELKTDENGYYSSTVHGQTLSWYGYHTVDVYIDNGTNDDYNQVGHGKYEVEHNTWADVKASTGIFVSSHM